MMGLEGDRDVIRALVVGTAAPRIVAVVRHEGEVKSTPGVTAAHESGTAVVKDVKPRLKNGVQ